MPQHPSMSDEQKAQAIQLRSEGLSYVRVAAKVGCSETVAFKFLSGLSKPAALKPEPIQKQPNRKNSPANLLPPREFHHVGSCPIRRSISFAMLNAPPMTKTEMALMLAEAVRNTARL